MNVHIRRRAPVFAVLFAALSCSGGGDDPAGSRAGSSNGSRPGGAAGAGSGFGNAQQPGSGGATVLPPTSGPGSPGGVCEVAHLTASPDTPDMLIVLDRSGSMAVEGRWEPSASAVRRITTELQSQIRFGLAMFPDGASTTGVQIDASACISAPDPIACFGALLADAGVVNVNNGATGGGDCAPGGIVVPMAIDNGPAIGQRLDTTFPSGGTPTGETLQRLVDEYANAAVDPDAVPHAKFILLVTDGQPTCPAGGGSETTQPDIDISNSAVEQLTARGVRTYVIGYNTTGPGNEQLAAVLDGFATRGGTGDTQHRPVEDEASLLTEFQRIAGDVVGCSFVLDQAPARADHVLVRLDGQQVNLDAGNGWQLIGDRTVQLMGASCATLKDGGNHAVDVEVRCQVVTPI
jgi:hypothetical protein